MKTMKITLYTLMLGVVLYSCKKEDTITNEDPNPGNGTGNGTVEGNTANKATLLTLVNNVRKAGCTCGSTAMPPVAAVTWNDLLEKAAYLHSADMNKNNYFDHVSKDGSTLGQRVTRTGYKWNAVNENIAKGYANEQAVMDGWLKSEGHCKNIMSSNVKEVGVGRDGIYWTQVFGARNQ